MPASTGQSRITSSELGACKLRLPRNKDLVNNLLAPRYKGLNKSHASTLGRLGLSIKAMQLTWSGKDCAVAPVSRKIIVPRITNGLIGRELDQLLYS